MVKEIDYLFDIILDEISDLLEIILIEKKIEYGDIIMKIENLV
jgi:hypothetical protein